MEVVRVVGSVVRRGPVPEVGVRHQPELLEELERPVDRRDVDALRRTADPLGDLVGGGMPEVGDRLEHQLPLRGQPVAPGAQLRVPGVVAVPGLHPAKCRRARYPRRFTTLTWTSVDRGAGSRAVTCAAGSRSRNVEPAPDTDDTATSPPMARASRRVM